MKAACGPNYPLRALGPDADNLSADFSVAHQSDVTIFVHLRSRPDIARLEKNDNLSRAPRSCLALCLSVCISLSCARALSLSLTQDWKENSLSLAETKKARLVIRAVSKATRLASSAGLVERGSAEFTSFTSTAGKLTPPPGSAKVGSASAARRYVTWFDTIILQVPEKAAEKLKILLVHFWGGGAGILVCVKRKRITCNHRGLTVSLPRDITLAGGGLSRIRRSVHAVVLVK